MYHVPSNRDEVQRMTWGNWLHWLFVSGLGLVGGQLTSLLFEPVTTSMTNVVAPEAPAAVLFFVLYGLSLCGIMAGVQWLLFLRQRAVPARWIGRAALGGLIFGVAGAVVALGETPSDYSFFTWIAVLTLSVFGVQWLTLRRYHPLAGRLVAAEALASLSLVLALMILS